MSGRRGTRESRPAHDAGSNASVTLAPAGTPGTDGATRDGTAGFRDRGTARRGRTSEPGPEPGSTGASLTLTLVNDLTAITRGVEAIEAHGMSRGWPAKWILHASLSLDELVSNVISHGYRDSDEHEIVVNVTEEDAALVVVLEDEAVAFDPFTDAPEADLDSALGDRDPRGLGVHLVKSFTDEAAYERRDGRNRTTLVLRHPEPMPVAASRRATAVDPEPAEMEELSRMTERDLRVAALDPLGLDDLFTSLVQGGAPDPGEAARRFRDVAGQALRRHWTREEALAGLRDLGMIASILEQRYAMRPCETECVAQALTALGAAAQEVPRETFYSHGPRNPTGSRMRTFTTLPEERTFNLSVSKGARCLPECILCLHRATSAPARDVAEHLTQAAMALEFLVSALVRVRRTMPPALFSAEIAPFSPVREVAGQRYLGPSAAQMGVLILDRMLFGAEITARGDYEAYYTETSPYLPRELRAIARRQRDRPSLMDLARGEPSLERDAMVSLREVFQILYKFRVPHLRLARESFASRPEGTKGSGGYDPGFLEMLANFSRSSIDELNALIGDR